MIIVGWELDLISSPSCWLHISKRELRNPNYYLAALALADAILFLLILLFILWLSHHFDGVDPFFWPGIYQTFKG